MSSERLTPRESEAACLVEQQSVAMSFQLAHPAIAKYPHLIFRNGPSTLHRVLSRVRARVGVWGARPLYNHDSSGYLEPDEGLSGVDFCLYALPLNQDEVLRHQAYGKDPFTIVIDVETPVGVIAEMWRTAGTKEDLSYDRCIALVPEWIEMLRWAYVPLQYEWVNGLFITSHAAAHLVQEVAQDLRADGERAWKAQVSNDGSHEVFPV